MKHPRAIVAAGVGLLLVLTGCAPGSTGNNGSNESVLGCVDTIPEGGQLSAGQALRDSLQGVTLTFVGGGGTYQEAHSNYFVKPFALCTGAQMLEESVASDAKIQAQVDAGQVSWDIVAGGRNLANKCGEYLEELDTSIVDLSRTRHTELVGPCLAPMDIAPVYMAYDPAKFPTDPPSSIEDFFDVEKYPGKRSLYGSVAVPVVNFPVAVANMLGYTQENMYDPEFPVDEVFAKIDSIKDHIVWVGTFAEEQQIIESGEVSMGFFAAGRVWAAAQNGAKFTPVWGEGNWVFAVDNLIVPKGAKNPEAAMAFINYALGAKQQEFVTAATVYSPSHMDAVPTVPAEMEPYYAGPDEVENGVPTTHPYWLTYPEVNAGMWNDYLLGK